MKSILIDSDVLIDFFFDRKPFSDDAAHILALCEAKTIKGYVTPVIISNVYYLLRQQGKHEKVIESLRSLLMITDVLITDKDVLLKALNSPFKDYEDAIQNYSAESAPEGIQTIITRNIKDYRNSALSIMTPDAFLKNPVIRTQNKK